MPRCDGFAHLVVDSKLATQGIAVGGQFNQPFRQDGNAVAVAARMRAFGIHRFCQQLDERFKQPLLLNNQFS
jgi:hypothetical protein